MYAAYQARVVTLECTDRVQDILDDGLLQPCAVCLVGKSVFGFLYDGSNLFGQPFLLRCRYCRCASIAQAVGIPILVMDCKGRNHLYIYALLTNPEADV